jgi:DNA-binding CsgD family transcriptional regulator
MFDLSSYIQDIENACDRQTALSILRAAIQEKGFQYYFFSNLNTRSSPAIFKVKFFETTYPKEWAEIYVRDQYAFYDPIALAVMDNKSPFYWSQLLKNQDKPLSDEAKNILQHATTYGIVDGVGLSYLLNQGNLYTITISTNKMITDYDADCLSQLYLLGSKLVDRFEKESEALTKDIHLSDQETRIVTVAAIGKTDAEIAQILGISSHTVRYHWKNIFEKLQSYSRVFAIIQAMNLGFVDNSILDVTSDSGSSQIYTRSVNSNQ